MENRYGYIRVSSKDQKEDRQVQALRGLEISEKIFSALAFAI